MKTVDQRLDQLIQIAVNYNYPLDDVVAIMGDCDDKTFRALSDKPSSLPRYMKSKVSP